MLRSFVPSTLTPTLSLREREQFETIQSLCCSLSFKERARER
jgi:hypothetical protein